MPFRKCKRRERQRLEWGNRIARGQDLDLPGAGRRSTLSLEARPVFGGLIKHSGHKYSGSRDTDARGQASGRIGESNGTHEKQNPG